MAHLHAAHATFDRVAFFLFCLYNFTAAIITPAMRVCGCGLIKCVLTGRIFGRNALLQNLLWYACVAAYCPIKARRI